MARNVDKRYLLLEEPNLYRAFFILTLPVFGANFMKAFNELVDTFFIGQIADSVAAQAGVSIAWPLINIFAAFQIGFGVAGVAVISQLMGANRKEEAQDSAGILLMISVVLGLLLNIVLYCTAPAVMTLMGATGSTLEASVSYVQIRSFEFFFTFVFATFQAVRQAQGDTVTPVVLSVSAVVLNICLTAYFVQVLQLGVWGAGCATVIGNAVITPFCLYLLFSKKQSFHLEKANLKLQPFLLFRLIRVATPAAASQAFSALGFVVLQSIILSYGDYVAAAFSVGNKIGNLLLMPVMALGSVLAAYVGQNIGAGNGPRARKAYIASRNIGLMISIIGSLVIFPFRHVIIPLLTNDPLTQVTAMEYFFWVLLIQPLLMLFQNYLGAFNGSGNTKYSLILATVRLWAMRVPLVLFFKNFTDLGNSGVWYAMTISNFLILILGFLLFRRVKFEPIQRQYQNTKRVPG